MDEVPVFTTGTSLNVDEGVTTVSTVVAVDPEGVGVTYFLTGGADVGLFQIHPTTGALSIVPVQDFEVPVDSDLDGIYEVEVSATDGTTAATQQLIQVTIDDVDEAPVFTSPMLVSVAESGGAINVQASDPEGGLVTYAITGGSDSAAFSINASSGALTFLQAPDFENPTRLLAATIRMISRLRRRTIPAIPRHKPSMLRSRMSTKRRSLVRPPSFTPTRGK